MSEEIKTILTADSSELAAEFAKASAIAQKYAADRERQSARQLASAEASLEALRLEALGHTSAASALREKMALVEKAVSLSDRTGISEQRALRIAEQELALRQTIAAEREKEAAVAARAARIAAPGKNGVSLPELALTQANMQAMEKHAFRMEALQKKMNGGFGSSSKGTGQAMGLLAVSSAIDDVQYGFRGVINNIPQATMAFGGFSEASMVLAARLGIYAVAGYAAFNIGKKLGADDSVLKWAEAQTEALKAAKDTLEKYQKATQLRRFKDESAAAANRELEEGNRLIARRLELDKDLQAALDRKQAATARRRAGEDQIVAAAGASGMVSNDRIVKATRNLEDKRAAEDAESAQKRMIELGRQWEAIQKETSNIAGDYARQRSEITQQFEAESNHLDILRSKEAELKVLLDEKNKGSMSPTDVLRTKRDLENIQKQIEAAEQLTITQKDRMAALDQLTKKAADEGRQSLDSLRKQQDAQRDIISQLSDQERLRNQIRALEDGAFQRVKDNWQIELRIQQALAAGDPERARNIERQRDIEAERLRILKSQVDITDAQAAAMAAQLVDTRANASAAASRKQAEEELAILRARASGQNDRAGSLRQAANLEREILQIMREQNLTRAEATKQAREKIQLERNQARSDIMAELTALRMEASGNKRGAAQLREETRLRAEALTLADRLGITETQAQSLLREKARLQREIEAHQKQTHRSPIYMKDEWEPRRGGIGANANTSGAYLNTRGATLGLAPHALDQRAHQRTAARRDPTAENAAHNLLRSVNIQAEMLEIWKKIGVV